jgi:serine/threonine-protein kinase
MRRERIGRYQIGDKIGAGAMGEVYRARDPDRQIDIAVKILPHDMADEEELVERFRREAQSAAGLHHPNIIRVYDFGEDDGLLYMAMELLSGADLKELIERRALQGLPQKFSIMLQVADGLAFVHARDIVHRDLKPGNIHILPDGRAKIMDFGLVRLGDSNMTRAGMVMGSPSYMAPEQMRGQRADVRSDVFSLGAVYWELLAGRRAFDGKGIHQILLAVLTHEPPPVDEVAPEVPKRLGAIVTRALCKDPKGRYQNGGELRDALRSLTPQGA